VPRAECLIQENPSGTVLPADVLSTLAKRLQRPSGKRAPQLALDALWYIDPDRGVDGVWDDAHRSRAAESTMTTSPR
jgi:peptide/nickel transport system substrate-binding protein